MPLLPHWAVERGVFPVREEKRLIQTLQDREISTHTFGGHEFRNSDEIAQCAVSRGSCYFVRESSSNADWLAPLWGTPGQFSCSSYYPLFKEWMLNEPYKVISLAELCFTYEDCFRTVGREGKLFIRPDDGFKSFEGGVVTQTGFEKWVEKLDLLQVARNTPVLIAAPKPILQEWRFLIVERKVITGSQYRPVESICNSGTAFEEAEEIAQEAPWSVKAYALDLCLTSGGIKALEVSSLWCVAWYDADAGKLVDEVQALIPK